MGLFKKIFGKTRQEIPKQKVRIDFSEIKSFLREETEPKKLELERKIGKFRETFISHYHKLIECFDSFYHSNFERLILEDKRDISKIVETNRRNYCERSKKLLSRAIRSLDGEKSPEKIDSIVTETFNKLNSFSRETQILTLAFKKQIKEISDNLKKLKQEEDHFKFFLNSDYKIIQKENEVKELIEKIRKEKSDKRKKELQRIEIDKEIKKLKGRINLLDSEILKIKNSEQRAIIEELERDQKFLQSQKDELISELNNKVSEISRYIKKYLHQRKLDKTTHTIIMNFLEKPERLLQYNSSVFEKTVQDVRSEIEKIEKDEKKRKKFLSVEDQLKTRLPAIKTNYQQISDKLSRNIAKIQELKSEISTEEQEKELNKLKERLQQLGEEREELEKEEKYDPKQIIKEIENLLSEISGKKVEINYI